MSKTQVKTWSYQPLDVLLYVLLYESFPVEKNEGREKSLHVFLSKVIHLMTEMRYDLCKGQGMQEGVKREGETIDLRQ